MKTSFTNDVKSQSAERSVSLTRQALTQNEGLALVLALAALFWLFVDVFSWMSRLWSDNPDYSHGYLIPFFAAYILWSNRRALGHVQENAHKTQSDTQSPSGLCGVQTDSGLWLGGILMGCGLLTRMAGIYLRYQSLEGVSLIPFVLGIITIIFGKRAARWGAPAILFLIFMVPLPSFLSGQLSGLLQAIATSVSTFAFQTLGIPAFAEGNIIMLGRGQIGVAEACSGLRMLFAFFALTVGACLMIDRTLIEKMLIALSAVPIAILANCVRIIATGIAFEYLDEETAKHIFHDVAGWLMMPLGFTMLLAVLAILDRLIVPETRLTV